MVRRFSVLEKFRLNASFLITVQGRQKQSVDGQAQLDVGGKDTNTQAKRAAKFGLSYF